MNKNIFHILVVDDDDRIRELVKQYLEENNFLVTTAIDAFDAKNKLDIIKKIDTSLFEKQILSFIAASINHKSVRKKIIKELLSSDLFDKDLRDFLNELNSNNTSLQLIMEKLKYKNKCVREFENITGLDWPL